MNEIHPEYLKSLDVVGLIGWHASVALRGVREPSLFSYMVGVLDHNGKERAPTPTLLLSSMVANF